MEEIELENICYLKNELVDIDTNYLYLKRILDIIMVFLLLPFLLFFLFSTSLIILISMGWPVFYCHYRIGKGGKIFPMWKFRTMVENADKVLQDYLDNDPEMLEEWKKNFKFKDDPRVSPVGKILRKCSIDELPQFWNVLKGDMSLVGPRPIVEEEIQYYGSMFRYYSLVRPGITGAWQVNGRNDVGYPDRARIETDYVKNIGFWLDIKILIKTIYIVIKRNGAY